MFSMPVWTPTSSPVHHRHTRMGNFHCGTHCPPSEKGMISRIQVCVWLLYSNGIYCASHGEFVTDSMPKRLFKYWWWKVKTISLFRVLQYFAYLRKLCNICLFKQQFRTGKSLNFLRKVNRQGKKRRAFLKSRNIYLNKGYSVFTYFVFHLQSEKDSCPRLPRQAT